MKTLLIAGFGVLCVAAVLFPAWALRRRILAVDTRRDENVAAYKARCAELRADVDAGRLTEDDYAQLEAEAANDLVHAARDEAPDTGVGARWPVVLAMVVIPLVAVGLYAAGGGLPPMSHGEQMRGLLAQLEARVDDQPEDVQAWQMLGRAYMATERYANAARAYSRVNTITESRNADWLVAEGEAMAFARDRDLLGRPAALFDAALAIDPEHIRALWYASLAESQQGNRAQAVEHLQTLARLDLDDPLHSAVREALASLGAPVPETASASRGPALAVTVEIDTALAQDVPRGATLFVFAKAAGGSPMPLAVERVSAPAFPATVTLDDDDAMAEGVALSQADTWEVTARISQAGQARAASGDLQGTATIAAGDAGNGLTVVIDERVE